MDTNAKPSDRLMAVKEVARAIDQHPATVYRKIRSGEIPAVRLGSETAAIRVPSHDFEQWLYGPAGYSPPLARPVPAAPAGDREVNAGSRTPVESAG